MIKTIIFDLDGVILESVDVKTNAFAKLFEKDYPDKIKAIVDYHTHHMGVSRFVKFRHIYKDILKKSLSEQKEKELGEQFSALALKGVLECPFVKGAAEFIKDNYKKYTFFVISGTPDGELKDVVEKRGIRSYFKEVYGSPPGKTQKVAEVLKENKLKPEETLFIGDATTDYQAAKDNGLHFIAIVSSHAHILRDCPNQLKDLVGVHDLISAIERP